MATLFHKIKQFVVSPEVMDPQSGAKSFFIGYYERHPVSEKTKVLEAVETHKELEAQRNAYLQRRKAGIV